jgi:hypothetical protein
MPLFAPAKGHPVGQNLAFCPKPDRGGIRLVGQEASPPEAGKLPPYDV